MSEISTSRATLPTFRRVWRDYVHFLRRPRLPQAQMGFGHEGVETTLALFALDLAAMLSLALVALAVVGLGAEMPHHALDGMKMTGMLWLLIVLVGPIVEESAFRGWLVGTPRALGLCASFVAAAGAILLTPVFDRFALAALFAALLAGVFASLLWLRGDRPLARFDAFFPYLYWVSCVAFALVHLTNLTLGQNRLAVLWVAPQLVLGTVLGYARVRVGMWSNIALHMAHNAVVMGVAAASGIGG